MGFLFGFICGIVVTVVFMLFPRTIMKAVFKQWILLGNKMTQIRAAALEDLEDLKAETEAELEQSKQS